MDLEIIDQGYAAQTVTVVATSPAGCELLSQIFGPGAPEREIVKRKGLDFATFAARKGLIVEGAGYTTRGSVHVYGA